MLRYLQGTDKCSETTFPLTVTSCFWFLGVLQPVSLGTTASEKPLFQTTRNGDVQISVRSLKYCFILDLGQVLETNKVRGRK